MKTENIKSQYDTQAENFLASNNIKFRATLSDSKTPAWKADGEKCGHHFRVTLSKSNPLGSSQGFDVLRAGKVVDTVFYSASAKVDCAEVLKSLREYDGVTCDSVRKCGIRGGRLTFDFWSSIADAQAGIKTVSAYSVLACISGDANCPDNFADFLAEYGYEQDSIKALQTFRRCSSFAKRLQSFFTAGELEQLAEIN